MQGGKREKSKETKNRLFYLKSLRENTAGLRVLEQLSRRKKGQKKAKKWPFDFSAIWKKGSISLNPFFFLFLILYVLGIGWDWIGNELEKSINTLEKQFYFKKSMR